MVISRKNNKRGYEMGFRNFIKKLIHSYKHSSESYLNFLRSRGAKIGENCHIFSSTTVNIDLQRPYLLEFGNQVVLTENVTILTHDYSHTVMRKKYGDNIGDAKSVKIGNNVFIGMDSIVLMGTEIGDNVIIGAKTVVRGKIPSNVVVAGNPCKIVCTIEEYYKKRQENEIACAFESVRYCKERLGRYPTIREMGDAFAWLYLSRTEETIKEYPEFFNLPSENAEDLKRDFLNGKSKYNTYEEFLEDFEKCNN